MYLFFFFSSRRRHTRLQGDWSSDVCSSDLPKNPIVPVTVTKPAPVEERKYEERTYRETDLRSTPQVPSAPPTPMLPAPKPEPPVHEITVVRGNTTEKVVIKQDRKSSHRSGTRAA